MRVQQLWRYPVKSIGGEQLSPAQVTPVGIEGDRRWALLDVATGCTLTARREPRLLFASAHLLAVDAVEIVLPDGRRTSSDKDLSEWLQREVVLTAASPTSGGTYEAPRDFEDESDWRSWEAPPAAWHDTARARISLVSTGTIGAWDVRRFRPNVLLEGGHEDGLVGRRVSLGGALLTVTKQLTRCVMVTRAQPGVERDLDVLRRINRDRAAHLAIGATVLEPGVVAVGDTLKVEDAAPN